MVHRIILIFILFLSLSLFFVGAEKSVEIAADGIQTSSNNSTKPIPKKPRPTVPRYYLNLKRETYYEDIEHMEGAIQFKHPINHFVSRSLQLHTRLEIHKDSLPINFLDFSPVLSLQLSPLALNCTQCPSIPPVVFAINTKELPVKQISHTFHHPAPGVYVLEAKLFFQDQLVLAYNSTPSYYLYGSNPISDQELFEKWLRLNGAILNANVATFTSDDGYEYRGLAVSKDVPKGSPVLSVPSKLTISYHSIRQTPFTWIYPDFENYYEETQILPLFLIYCAIFHEECSYYPYILSLPKYREMPLLPIKYKPHDLKLFEGTIYVEDLEVRRNNDLDRQFEILKLLKEGDAFYPMLFDDRDNGEKTAKQWISWAITMVHSRAWGSDPARFGAHSVLIPYLDLANHDNDGPFMNNRIANYMSIHANRPLKQGEQFFDNYGKEKMFNSKLLYYGWADLRDQVFIVLDLFRIVPQPDGDEDKIFASRMKILQQFNSDWDELEALKLLYNNEESAKNVLLGLRIFALNDTDIGNRSSEQIMEVMKNNTNLIFDMEHEKYSLKIIEDYMDNFFKSNEAFTDEHGLQIISSSSSSMLEKAAAKVRMEERKILKWFSTIIQQHKQQIGFVE